MTVASRGRKSSGGILRSRFVFCLLAVNQSILDVLSFRERGHWLYISVNLRDQRSDNGGRLHPRGEIAGWRTDTKLSFIASSNGSFDPKPIATSRCLFP
jgi:hypothetical protein